MKEAELRAHATCDLCHSLIGKTGVPLFWTVRLQQHGIDGHAVRRQTGLGLQIGARLAMLMGPDEEMTVTLTDVELTICSDCALKEVHVYRMAELAGERDRRAEAEESAG